MPITVNQQGWDELASAIVMVDLVARMQRVADACNEQAGLTDGYMVGIQGDDVLQKHDRRMTVITATAEAMADNAKNNRLVANFYLAGGE